MKEYIERQAAVRVVQDYGIRAIHNGAIELDPVDDIVELARELDAMPAAKVGPRGIYGHWWDDGSGNTMCSVCCSKGSSEFKYCPMCGTKMMGDGANDCINLSNQSKMEAWSGEIVFEPCESGETVRKGN